MAHCRTKFAKKSHRFPVNVLPNFAKLVLLRLICEIFKLVVSTPIQESAKIFHLCKNFITLRY